MVPPARPAATVVEAQPPRGIDRIALLHDLRGRFDPDQVTGLLAPSGKFHHGGTEGTEEEKRYYFFSSSVPSVPPW